MKNIYEQNLPCTFTEQLASYLYDEIAATEKVLFESHLQNCDSCAIELADFSALRSSILEWRETDFAPLQIPVIVLPETGKSVATKRSWFKILRAALIFSPARTAFASLFVLLIFAGIFWLATKPFGYQETAELNNLEKTPVNETKTPIMDQNNLTADSSVKSETNQNNSSDKSTENVVAKSKSASMKPKNLDDKIPVAVVKSETALQKNSSKSTDLKSKAIQLAKKSSRTDVPAIEDEEEEDDSLRLTDLFDEVGMNNSAEEKEGK
jgi:hypothetical protein